MRAYLHGTKGHAVRNVDSERGVVQIMGRGRGEGGGPDQKYIYSVKLLGQDLQGKEWKKNRYAPIKIRTNRSPAP